MAQKKSKDTSIIWRFLITDRGSKDENKAFINDPNTLVNPDNRPPAIMFAGGGQPHNNMPPFYALTYIIKY